MRTLLAAVICTVLLSATTSPERPTPPTIAANSVTFSTVRPASEIGLVRPGDDRDALLVQRPYGATEGARASVFVVDATGAMLRRVAVEYARTSISLIEIAGVSRGDQIVVSDMRQWDAFERLRLR